MVSSERPTTEPRHVGGSTTGISSTTPCLHGRITLGEAKSRRVSALARPRSGQTSDDRTSCNYHIRSLKQRCHLPPEVANSVDCSILKSRLDYCNTLLYGMSHGNLLKLQRTSLQRTNNMKQSTAASKIEPSLLSFKN